MTSQRIRIALASALSTAGWLYMSVMLGVMILKGVMGQPYVPTAVYIGIAASVFALLAAGLLTGSMKGVAAIASLWVLVGVLVHPYTMALSWAIGSDRWLIAVLLIVVVALGGTYRVKFQTEEISKVDSSRDVI